MAKVLEEMYFEKMHGASNDFIFLDVNLYLKFVEISFAKSNAKVTNKTLFLREFVKNICHRSQGVGADGVVFFQYQQKSKSLAKKHNNKSAIQILIVNSDGSFAATCGNALRCLGLKLMRDKLWNGLEKLKIDRIHPDIFAFKIKEIDKDEEFMSEKSPFAVLISGKYTKKPDLALISVAMGVEKKVFLTPLVENSLIHFGSDIEFLTPIFVQLSNPHWVFISLRFNHFSLKQFEEFGQLAQAELRRKVLGESVPLANIGMLALSDKNNLDNYIERNIFPKNPEKKNQQTAQNWNLHVYERGAGLTACCGSGATAARIVLEFSERIPKALSHVYFKMPGGTVSIENEVIENEEQRVLSGEAQFVFQGLAKLTSFSK
ncbi:hypothetical protein [Fluviispira sanaruensis]|uniref:diaminopimelate epimerase n=1 Tax=Fluviispira sanaruensis TaxID=2493639 RepID=A0A4P2VNX9_FLUSA|nr:hypothetical protein [Fluviispira sanaruensis]BBH53369.1 diaminopimelate epimerase [Fluviispira sanaruensis]